MVNQSTGNLDVLPRLIELVYAASYDDRVWVDFLSALSDTAKGNGAALMVHDVNQVRSMAAFGRLDPEVMRLYNEHFRAHDPLVVSLRTRRPEDRSGVFVCKAVVNRAE